MSVSRNRAEGRVWTVEAPELAGIISWWTSNARALPWRARRDVYGVWVAEVMSAQTTVGRAAAAWLRWMERWPSVEALAAASLHEVLGEWQGLGYPRRARDLHRSAAIVVERGWPAELTELPGVGPYVAAAIRCFALEQPLLPRDVNVRRVLERRLPGEVDISGDPWRAGQAIMEFGQRICSSRPRCDICAVQAGCRGPAPSRGAAVRRQGRFEGSLRQRRGRLLRQVIGEGPIAVEEPDLVAAAGLAEDGLAVLEDGWLHPPA